MNKFVRPETFAEFEQLKAELDSWLIFSGGTEIMTDYRQGKIKPDTWIDIKRLPGMREQTADSLGACVFLNEITQPQYLVDTAQFVADHTIRNHLTLAGNVCGKLPYRETVLALLAADAEVSILSGGEMIRLPLKERFDKFFKLAPGELVCAFHFDRSERPYRHHRYTVSSVVDYPILTFLAVRTDQGYFVGLSGYGSVPQYGWFDSWDEKAILNHFTPVTNDRASAAYRKRLLEIELAKGAPDETV